MGYSREFTRSAADRSRLLLTRRARIGRRGQGLRSLAGLARLACLVLVAATSASAEDLDVRFEAWLDEVAPLMHVVERQLFDSLSEDYEREAFMRIFWRERDPYPQTGRNEFRERFFENLNRAREQFDTLEDARARFLLVHGEPSSVLEVRCTTTRVPAAVWVYRGSLQGRQEFVVLFLSDRNGSAPARVWRPSRPGAIDGAMRNMRDCMNGELLADVVEQLREQGPAYEDRLDRALAKPRPRSLEWVANFSADSASVPAGAGTLEAEEILEFGGREQSRTASIWTLLVASQGIGVERTSGVALHAFEVVGEVVRSEDLLETFRYLFRIPADAHAERLLPITFERLLRPGRYRVRLRLQDLVDGSYWASDREIEVPAADGIVLTESVGEPVPAEGIAGVLRAERPTIRVVEPDGLQRGAVRFDTLISGAEIERVRFFLEDQLVLTKTRPPFSVELDLGSFPEQRQLRVEALDGAGLVVATDQIELNAGGDRFAIRLSTPVVRTPDERSLIAEARVVAPRSTEVERVEFFLDEVLAASVFQEPWRAKLPVSDRAGPAFVRAVASLADGRTSEDVVVLGQGSAVEAEVDVQLVELFVSARDPSGRALGDLKAEDFEVLEDDVPQVVRRFEVFEDIPLRVAVVMDTSASMASSLAPARQAALGFLSRVVGPDDRGAVITFNRLARVAAPLTSDRRTLASSLVGLAAQGETALYDSLMYSLYYLAGVSGQRALLLLTDGRDEVSDFSFGETLDFARRSGVAIYTVGLDVSGGEGPERARLRALASETGGESIIVQDVSRLDEVYAEIERDLRSRYLLAYQSNSTRVDDGFRAVEVRCSKAAEIRSMRGYYP